MGLVAEGLIQRETSLAHAVRDMDWISANLRKTLPWISADSTKALCELAFVRHYLDRYRYLDAEINEAIGQQCAAWARFLERSVGSAEFAGLLLADRAEIAYRIQPYLWLRADGFRSVECERFVSELPEQDSPGIQHALWRAGRLALRPDFTPLWRQQVLTLSGKTETANGGAVFRATHAIFYATDMGLATAPVSAPELVDTTEILDRLARRCRTLHAWDALIEILLCRSILGPLPDDYREPVERLESVRRTDGSIPSSRPFESSAPNADSSPFYPLYHATLVHALTSVVLVVGAGRAMRGDHVRR